MLDFFEKKPEVLTVLINNLHTFPVFDLAKRLFSLRIEEYDKTYIVNYSITDKLLRQIIDIAIPENRNKVVSAADIFITLLNNMYLIHHGKKLIEDLLNPILFENLKLI